MFRFIYSLTFLILVQFIFSSSSSVIIVALVKRYCMTCCVFSNGYFLVQSVLTNSSLAIHLPLELLIYSCTSFLDILL